MSSAAFASPFNNGILENPSDYSEILTSFRKVSGMTCNTIPANLFQIGEIYIKNYPEIISLDGAAVLYACLESNTDVIQLSYVAGKLENATECLNVDDIEIDPRSRDEIPKILICPTFRMSGLL